MNDAKERENKTRSTVAEPDRFDKVGGTGRRHSPFRPRLAPGYIPGYYLGMSNPSQKRAVRRYRDRLSRRGITRFEVLGLDADRDLIRALARRLAEDGSEAAEIRAVVRRRIAGEPPKKGGILAALRRSPLVGADLDLSRPQESGRPVDL